MVTNYDDYTDILAEDDRESKESVQQAFARAEGIVAERRRARGQEERREAQAAPEPIKAERVKAEADLAALRGELEGLDAEYLTARSPEVALQRDRVVRRLKDAEAGLPHVGRSDEDLLAGLEDTEARAEELREIRDKLPKDSVRYRRAEREWAATLGEKDRIQAELVVRHEKRAISEIAGRQVRKRAIEGIKREREAEARRLERLVRGQDYRGLPVAKLKLDIQQAELLAKAQPTEEEIEARLPVAKQEYLATIESRWKNPIYGPYTPAIPPEFENLEGGR